MQRTLKAVPFFLIVGLLINVSLCWLVSANQRQLGRSGSWGQRVATTSGSPTWVCEVSRSLLYDQISSSVGPYNWENGMSVNDVVEDRTDFQAPSWSRPARLDHREWLRVRESLFPRKSWSLSIPVAEITAKATPTASPFDFYIDHNEFAYGLPFRSLVATAITDEWMPGVHDTTPDTIWLSSGYLPLRPIWPGLVANSVVWGAVAWLLYFAFCAHLKQRRRKRGLCPNCRYDLKGAISEVCPECGQEHQLALSAHIRPATC